MTSQSYPQAVDVLWTVTRSMLDSRVWLPFDHEDETCLMYAGTLRAVKGWVAKQVGDMSEVRWIKDGPDHWRLVPRHSKDPCPHDGQSCSNSKDGP